MARYNLTLKRIEPKTAALLGAIISAAQGLIGGIVGLLFQKGDGQALGTAAPFTGLLLGALSGFVTGFLFALVANVLLNAVGGLPLQADGALPLGHEDKPPLS
jgi:hypothetical protein